MLDINAAGLPTRFMPIIATKETFAALYYAP
jgi:hypothetical protein